MDLFNYTHQAKICSLKPDSCIRMISDSFDLLVSIIRNY